MKLIAIAKFINDIQLVSARGAFALIVNNFIGISSVPGGYTIIVVPNSPKHRIKVSTNDANKAGMSNGSVIFRYFLPGLMPATVADSSSDRGICFMPFPIIRAEIKENLPMYPIIIISDDAYIKFIAGLLKKPIRAIPRTVEGIIKTIKRNELGRLKLCLSFNHEVHRPMIEIINAPISASTDVWIIVGLISSHAL